LMSRIASLARLSIWLSELTNLLMVCAALAAPPVRLSMPKFYIPSLAPFAEKELPDLALGAPL